MKPTEAQKQYLSKCFGCARFVYNRALAEKIDAYSSSKKSLSFFDLCASLRETKKLEEFAWLNEVPALMLNYSLLNLNNAYTHFFKTKNGFPKFRSKKRSHNSVKFDPNSTKYNFDQFVVRIPKLGWVRLCRERVFDASAVKVNSTTVSRDACGTYWCTISVDDGIPPKPKAKVRRENAVGVDVGISNFAVLSDGTRIPNMHFAESEQRHIAKMQRGLARKQRGSKTEEPSHRYIRYKTKLARIHRRIENRRTDFLQKTTTALMKRYDTVCIEDLNVKGMMRNHSLAGSIASASWSRFVRMLDYKGEWYGVNVLRAGRFDPTSQTCSVCGCRNAGTKDLSVREWTCPECGTHHERDFNAAVNIMDVAMNRYFNEQSPAVTGITDADGVDSENNAGIESPVCDYASDETSMQE